MKLVQIDPPGTWCLNRAFFEMISSIDEMSSFVEIGPGEGKVSKNLCEKWALKGTGIDFSTEIIENLSANMNDFIESGQYEIVASDFMKDDLNLKADLVFSTMVMEHIENDLKFLERMKKLTTPCGKVVVAVPGRRNKWGIEDEIYGHFRRYDRSDLLNLFEKAGFRDIQVWSVGVPVSNLLYGLSNQIFKKSQLVNNIQLSQHKKTELSGFKDIPYKTLFPPCAKLLLNDVAMQPLYFFQRLFYNTNAGLTMIGSGRPN